MNDRVKRRKLAAAVIVTVLVIAVYGVYIGLACFIDDIPLFIRVIVGVACLPLIGLAVGALVSRIKEIRSGEEDDLSKY